MQELQGKLVGGCQAIGCQRRGYFIGYDQEVGACGIVGGGDEQSTFRVQIACPAEIGRVGDASRIGDIKHHGSVRALEPDKGIGAPADLADRDPLRFGALVVGARIVKGAGQGRDDPFDDVGRIENDPARVIEDRE